MQRLPTMKLAFISKRKTPFTININLTLHRFYFHRGCFVASRSFSLTCHLSPLSYPSYKKTECLWLFLASCLRARHGLIADFLSASFLFEMTAINSSFHRLGLRRTQTCLLRAERNRQHLKTKMIKAASSDAFNLVIFVLSSVDILLRRISYPPQATLLVDMNVK